MKTYKIFHMEHLKDIITFYSFNFTTKKSSDILIRQGKKLERKMRTYNSNQTVTFNVQYICLINEKIWPTHLLKDITLATS
jgi:hypothetical protein